MREDLENLIKFLKAAELAQENGKIAEIGDYTRTSEDPPYFTMERNDGKFDVVKKGDNDNVVIYKDEEGKNEMSVIGYKEFVSYLANPSLHETKNVNLKTKTKMSKNIKLNEYPDFQAAQAPEQMGLSNRRKGAQQAIKSKGLDDCTEEQYALCYLLGMFGADRMGKLLGQPYNSMTVDQIAQDAGMKPGTLKMNAENVKYIIHGQSSLEKSSPKSEEFVAKFVDLDAKMVANIARKAFDGVGDGEGQKPGMGYKGKPHAAFAKQKQITKAPTNSPEEVAKLNVDRASRGLPLLQLRGDRLVRAESYIPVESMKKYISNLQPTNEDSKFVNGFNSKSLNESKTYISEVNDVKGLMGKYKCAKVAGKNELAQVLYSKAKNIMEATIQDMINEVEEITGQKVSLIEKKN